MQHEVAREWIYERMVEQNITGETVLCVGARDDCEVDFFTQRGFDAIGIDLYTTEKIVKCDMSKIDKHPFLKEQRFDIVFSCHSLEHCLDLKGFARSLRLVCDRYFICMMPFVTDPHWWDCQRPEFADYAGTDEYEKKLAETFPGFDVAFSEIQKHGSRGFFILQKQEK